MRPGRGAERETELCVMPQIGRKSVRAADKESRAGNLLVPKTAEMPGKGGAVDLVAALIERHHRGSLGDRRQDCGGFGGHAGCGVARTALGNFMNFKAAEAELAADVVEALAIAFGQYPLRTLLQPAD